MVSSNNYWFYLEPTTFVFKDIEKYLLYNSENGAKAIVRRNDNIDLFVYDLQNLNNLYCVNLKNYHQDKCIMSFIKVAREKYMGDIIHCAKAPIVIPPIFKCHADKPTGDLFFSEGTSLMPLLNNITFHLNGSCGQTCKYCSMYYRQFNCCYKNKEQLSFKDILLKIEHCISTSDISLNFSGGNIFQYNELDLLLNYLNQKNIKSNFYFNYLNWDVKYEKYLLYKLFYYHVFIQYPYNENKLQTLMDSIKHVKDKIHFIFIITSEEEYLLSDKIINDNNLTWNTILPFYDGSNLCFFQQNVYLDTSDLSEACPDKNIIYKRQQINVHDFGKLTIDSQGNVFANINNSKIGNISEDLTQIIYNELHSGISWKRIRNNEPCNNCIYQYICPSPSNYEQVIGKNNLCTIK